MKMWQVWIRKRPADCSHTETVYIKARDQVDAWERADALFLEHYSVKAVLAEPQWIDQHQCGCGNTITWELEAVDDDE